MPIGNQTTKRSNSESEQYFDVGTPIAAQRDARRRGFFERIDFLLC